MKIEVTQTVIIEPIEDAFTEDFMADFRKFFSPFYDIEDHSKHIAQMVARGVINEVTRHYNKEFVEGYGEIGEFFKRAEIDDQYEEVI